MSTNASQPAKPVQQGGPKCPICKTPTDPEGKFFPFCGSRCKTIDLAKWISGDYVISRPIEEKDLEDQD